MANPATHWSRELWPWSRDGSEDEGEDDVQKHNPHDGTAITTMMMVVMMMMMMMRMMPAGELEVVVLSLFLVHLLSC